MSGDRVVSGRDVMICMTDTAGKFTAVGDSFAAQCGHDSADMIGRPAAMLRDPDANGAVFCALWERLQSDRPAAFYLRNTGSDGRCFLVFAVFLPFPGGVISLQFRPNIPEAPNLLLQFPGCLAVNSCDQQLPGRQEMVDTLGVSHMSRMLLEETAARTQGAGSAAAVAQARKMTALIASAQGQVARIATLFEDIQNVPTNIRILAAQIERGSGPIGVISTNHTTLSQEMLSGVQAFRQSVSNTGEAIDDAVFPACATALIAEAAKVRHDPRIDDRLTRLQAGLSRDSDATTTRIAAEARRFAEVTTDLKRHVAGLDVTRIMCKIENARFKDRSSGLTEIISNLEDVQTEISDQIFEIEKASHRIATMTRRLKGGTSVI
ncbi:MAG: PAS domain S-box protein [Rhodobacteraceae bacterium]|nr:PAS domain S-box protein [Paracoccaceae bacterium]